LTDDFGEDVGNEFDGEKLGQMKTPAGGRRRGLVVSS